MNLTQVGDDAFIRLKNNLPVEVDADRVTIESGAIPNMTTDKPAIVMSHTPGPRYATTIGDVKRRQRDGIIYFQVRTPAAFGAETKCIEISEKVSRLFEYVYVGNCLRYNECEIRKLGRDGAWYICNVVVNYSYEEVY